MDSSTTVAIITSLGGLTSCGITYFAAALQSKHRREEPVPVPAPQEPLPKPRPMPTPRPKPVPEPVEDTFWLDVVGIPLDLWCRMGTGGGPRGYTHTPEVLAYLERRRELGDFKQPVDLVKHVHRIIEPEVAEPDPLLSVLHCPFCGSGALTIDGNELSCQFCGGGWNRDVIPALRERMQDEPGYRELDDHEMAELLDHSSQAVRATFAVPPPQIGSDDVHPTASAYRAMADAYAVHLQDEMCHHCQDTIYDFAGVQIHTRRHA